MKYRYVGVGCMFAGKGDIFEESKHGYIHKIDDDSWVGVPTWMVEDNSEFEPVNDELEEFKQNLVTWLEDVIEYDENSKVGKRALKSVINYVEDYSTELPEEE